jgi:hypothetical protein
MRTTWLLGFCLVLLFSCKKENMGDCFKSTGVLSIEKRLLPEFDSIYVDRRLQVVLVEDTSYYAVIEAGSHLQELIRTDVENGKLTLRNDNKCNWTRSYKNVIKIEVHYTQLKHIVMWGASDITNEDTLKTPNLKVEFRDASGNINLLVNNQNMEVIQHTGAGDAIVRGKTTNLSVYMASLAYADYTGLAAKTVYVENKSATDCYVNGSESFSFRLRGDGNIFYKGQGEVLLSEKTGRGNIVQIN